MKTECVLPLLSRSSSVDSEGKSLDEDDLEGSAVNGDDIDMDEAEASMVRMFKAMGVPLPDRLLTREECWAAAHESAPDWVEVARMKAYAHGDAPSWDAIPEHEKDWRNFV